MATAVIAVKVTGVDAQVAVVPVIVTTGVVDCRLYCAWYGVFVWVLIVLKLPPTAAGLHTHEHEKQMQMAKVSSLALIR